VRRISRAAPDERLRAPVLLDACPSARLSRPRPGRTFTRRDDDFNCEWSNLSGANGRESESLLDEATRSRAGNPSREFAPNPTNAYAAGANHVRYARETLVSGREFLRPSQVTDDGRVWSTGLVRRLVVTGFNGGGQASKASKREEKSCCLKPEIARAERI